MSAASNQSNHPNPRGSGFGSVPVLFALRNVQPKIFAGTNSPATSIENVTTGLGDIPTTAKQPEVVLPTPIAAIESKAATAGQVRSINTTVNRVYNGAIALLVLALVFLVIRNSQNSGSKSFAKNDAKPTPENILEPLSETMPSDTSFTSVGAKNVSGQEQDPSLSEEPSQHASTDHDPVSNEVEEFQVGAIELGSPAPEPSSEIVSAPLPNLLMEEKGISLKSKSNNESGVQLASKPPIQPMLLEVSQGNPTSPSNAREIPARKNATGGAIPKAAASQSPVNNLVDTGVTLPIDLLIELHQKNSGNASSTNGLNSAKASTVSYPTYVPEAAMQSNASMQGNPMLTGSASSQMLTGQPYPPISPDYKPVTVPAYERNAEVNNMLGNNEASSGLLRQPSAKSSMHPAGQIIANGSNRYQVAPIQQPDASTTKQPYTPYVAPTQPIPPNLSGNSSGYPPISK